jgi:beta-glucosidase
VNLAHGAAVEALRLLVPNASIGAIHNFQLCLPATPADANAANLLGAYWNLALPDPQCLGHYPPQLAHAMEPHVRPGDLARICRPVDWFGMNHYSPLYAKDDPRGSLGFAQAAPPPEVPQTPIGWPIVPDAFRDALLAVDARYRLPIYVLENGFGAHDAPDGSGRILDIRRIDFLNAYIDAMRAAILRGADVRGYFVWSLLDNFEWTQGYSTRFGLVYVDYPTQKRTPKASFYRYANLIKAARQGEREATHGA